MTRPRLQNADAVEEGPSPTHEFDLFVVYASADDAFVREDLIPALELPSQRVLLVEELPIGGMKVAEINRGVSRSRYTVVVLSPAYRNERWAVFGEQLASYLSVNDVRLIPLRLIKCELPLDLEARVSLDFTDKDRWEWETARLRSLLHAPDVQAKRPSFPSSRRAARRRWALGALCGAAVVASLAVTWNLLWPPHAGPPPPPTGMVRIPAATIRPGVFAADSRPQECSILTASEDCAVLTNPERVEKIHVEEFDLDRFEITNGDFAAWLNANVHLWMLMPYHIVTTRTEPGIPLIRTEKCGDRLTIALENRAVATAEAVRWPVVCVSWYGANEYCRAQGKRLPLETEWELAAKGAEGRPFPWGAALPRQDGVAFELLGAATHPREVGASLQDATPEGVHDLGGNVAEWVEDRRGSPSERTLRGGSFHSSGPCHLLGSGCTRIAAEKNQKDIGFRCARSVIDRH